MQGCPATAHPPPSRPPLPASGPPRSAPECSLDSTSSSSLVTSKGWWQQCQPKSGEAASHAQLEREAAAERPGVPWKRDRKEAEPLADTHIKGPVPGALNTELCQASSPVAFYASFSEVTAALQTLKFNTSYIDAGSSYLPEQCGVHGFPLATLGLAISQ